MVESRSLSVRRRTGGATSRRSIEKGRGAKRSVPFRLLSLPTIVLAAVIGSFGGSAWAHFLIDINIRTFHVVHEEGRIRLLARLPMPWLVADKTGPANLQGNPAAAPYTTMHIEDGQARYSVNIDDLEDFPEGLGRLLEAGLILSVGDQRLRAKVGRVRGSPGEMQTPFSWLAEAEAALDGPVWPEGIPPVHVGKAMIDIELIYPVDARVERYTLRSVLTLPDPSETLDPPLPPDPLDPSNPSETANLIIDHASDPPLVFRVSGSMAEEVAISRSRWSAAATFIAQGLIHILEGTDHVLFVLCLVLGATGLRMLAWRITGFTIGHSLTLSLGFFGFAPQGAWFIPLVETGIALSIVYAAISALTGKDRLGMSLMVTTLLGLLHGAGFSFVLREILALDAPHLWTSLLAFNLGVEIGQLSIALVIWPILMLIAKAPKWFALARWTIALPCILIAMIWSGQRGMQIFFGGG